VRRVTDTRLTARAGADAVASTEVFMRAIITVFTALVLVAGAAPQDARAKDSVSIGMVLEPPILDPTAGAAAAIGEVTYQNIYQGLTQIEASGEVVPSLATAWDVSADGRTYTFHLAKGVVFSDGEAFGCDAVKFSLDRARAADSVNPQKALFTPIDNVACPDAATAVVTLKQPTASFLFGLAMPAAVMVAPNAAADDKTKPVGTGPYMLGEWVKGDHVTLVRNPKYAGPPPAMASATFRFIADPAAATAAMLAGNVDAFPLFPASEALPQLRADKKLTVEIGTTSGKIIVSLNEAKKPFDDVRVRRAMAYAIDKQAYNEAVLNGYGTPIGSHDVPGDAGYVDLVGTYPHDVAKAKALLAEAGYPNGFSMTMVLPPPAYARRGGEVIAAMLSDVGIQVKLVPVEWAQWLSQAFKNKDYEATIIAHVEPRDLYQYANPEYYWNYHNAAYDALWARYQAATDPKEQLALWGDLQKKLAEDEPNIFLAALPKIGVWNANLRGMWKNALITVDIVSQMSWAP
jgi:peptide/nickel transport system substrate-binding protein